MLSGRLNRLDHLRCVAALVVVPWHLHLVAGTVLPKNLVWSIFQQGYTGVSLFCVISGFIFTWIYTRKQINFRRFAVKRFFRIYPLFIFVLLISLYSSDDTARMKAVFSAITTINVGLPGYAYIGWSVLIELQFYLLFPFLLWMTARSGTPYLIGIIFLFIVLRTLHYGINGSVLSISYSTLFGRIDQFAMGMIAATLTLKIADKKSNKLILWTIGSLAAVLIMGFFFWFNLRYSGYYGPKSLPSSVWIVFPTIEAVCYAGLLVGYLAIPSIPGAIAATINQVVSYGGRISYSIYFTHLMVLPFITYIVVQNGLAPTSWEGQVRAFLFVALPIVIAFATITHYLIERPFIAMGESILEKDSGHA